tara:strand:+ start:267 stop:740 length:474 start_codon:yes stop_codon:yes gene_type:complete
MSFCLGAASVAGFVATVLVGEVTPDDVKTYVSMHGGTDSDLISFRQGMGSFGIEYDVSNFVRLFAEHQSSPMTCDDHPGLNYAGFKFIAPLADTVTAYSGLAIHDEEFDSNNKLKNPIIMSGIEFGNSPVKLYTEYMHSAAQLDDGRFYAGIKFLFD